MKNHHFLSFAGIIPAFFFLYGCSETTTIPEVEQWTTHEITLTAEKSYAYGYIRPAVI